MKTLSVVLLLLASVAFVLVGCSDNAGVPGIADRPVGARRTFA